MPNMSSVSSCSLLLAAGLAINQHATRCIPLWLLAPAEMLLLLLLLLCRKFTVLKWWWNSHCKTLSHTAVTGIFQDTTSKLLQIGYRENARRKFAMSSSSSIGIWLALDNVQMRIIYHHTHKTMLRTTNACYGWPLPNGLRQDIFWRRHEKLKNYCCHKTLRTTK